MMKLRMMLMQVFVVLIGTFHENFLNACLWGTVLHLHLLYLFRLDGFWHWLIFLNTTQHALCKYFTYAMYKTTDIANVQGVLKVRTLRYTHNVVPVLFYKPGVYP